MWETRTVQLNVQLPKDIADEAERVQKEEPDFLARVVLYGLTRRSIYRHLGERAKEARQPQQPAGPSACTCVPYTPRGMRPMVANPNCPWHGAGGTGV